MKSRKQTQKSHRKSFSNFTVSCNTQWSLSYVVKSLNFQKKWEKNIYISAQLSSLSQVIRCKKTSYFLCSSTHHFFFPLAHIRENVDVHDWNGISTLVSCGSVVAELILLVSLSCFAWFLCLKDSLCWHCPLACALLLRAMLLADSDLWIQKPWRCARAHTFPFSSRFKLVTSLQLFLRVRFGDFGRVNGCCHKILVKILLS